MNKSTFADLHQALTHQRTEYLAGAAVLQQSSARDSVCNFESQFYTFYYRFHVHMDDRSDVETGQSIKTS
jgi:hypothetical protein